MARSTTPRPPARRRTPASRKASETGGQGPRPTEGEAKPDEQKEAKPAPRRRAAAAKPKPRETEQPAASEKPKARPRPKKAAAKPEDDRPRATARPPENKREQEHAEPGRLAELKDRLGEQLPDLPQVDRRQAAWGAGLAAAVGAALYLWRATRADQPDYQVVEQDGPVEVREYSALVTAAVTRRGPRDDALNQGFDALADYIFGRTPGGRKLGMTAPVLSDGADKSGWRTRFIMPAGLARADLPPAPAELTLSSEPPMRIAAIRFAGRADDALLAEQEERLRAWLRGKSYPHEAKAVHAFYNSPMMPGPFRRNEVLLTLSEG